MSEERILHESLRNLPQEDLDKLSDTMKFGPVKEMTDRLEKESIQLLNGMNDLFKGNMGGSIANALLISYAWHIRVFPQSVKDLYFDHFREWIEGYIERFKTGELTIPMRATQE